MNDFGFRKAFNDNSINISSNDQIKKSLITVPIEQLALSQFNPRTTRSAEYVNKLAQRIARNGFEITRAMWAYRNNDGYEVFAGGTRLEAARRADLEEVPIILHEGLSDEDIVRLAEEDNENDEYHEKVCPVDVWAHYAWLADQGWIQERIAKAKNVTQQMVSLRIKLYSMPDEIKFLTNQESFSEAHLIEISKIQINLYFSDWLTTTQAQEELARKAVKDKSKNGSKSVKSVKQDVKHWKEFINYAEQVYQSLSNEVILYDFDQEPPTSRLYNAQSEFVSELTKIKARSLPKVKQAERSIRQLIADNLNIYHHYIETQSQEAALKAQRIEKEQQLLSKFVLGDCLEYLGNWQLPSIRLLLTDPPYGKEYQSNRRWRTKAPDKIRGDTEKEAMQLLTNVIQSTITYLADDAHILIFCDWRGEPEVRQILVNAGLIIKGSLIWVKEEHSAGDVKGSFGPSHERIVHAVKGSPRVSPRIRDVLEVSRSRETSHPMEKPVELLKKLITSTTNEGDLIIDPLAGTAATLIAAMELKRSFWGAEINPQYHEEGSIRLLKEAAL